MSSGITWRNIRSRWTNIFALIPNIFAPRKMFTCLSLWLAIRLKLIYSVLERIYWLWRRIGCSVILFYITLPFKNAIHVVFDRIYSVIYQIYLVVDPYDTKYWQTKIGIRTEYLWSKTKYIWSYQIYLVLKLNLFGQRPNIFGLGLGQQPNIFGLWA